MHPSLRGEVAVRKGLWVAEGVGFSGKSTLHPEIVAIKGLMMIAPSCNFIQGFEKYNIIHKLFSIEKPLLGKSVSTHSVLLYDMIAHLMLLPQGWLSCSLERVQGNSLQCTTHCLQLQTLASEQSSFLCFGVIQNSHCLVAMSFSHRAYITLISLQYNWSLACTLGGVYILPCEPN